MIKYSKYFILLLVWAFTFFGGWFASAHHRTYVQMPIGAARLEIPKNCQPRKWMNGIETDCKDGATIYYASKLERPSPR